MDLVSDEHDLPRDRSGKRTAARDAANALFSREGNFRSRAGFRRVTSTTTHSFGCGYCVAGGNLCRSSGTNVPTVLQALTEDAPASFTVVNGETVYSTVHEIGVIGAGDVVRLLAPARPRNPVASADAAGGLDAGRYAVAMSVSVNGQESGLSRATFVQVPAGGGILLENLPAGARVYRTQANGDVLYRAQDYVAGAAAAILGRASLGKAADTGNLEALPPGEFVRYWKGRLLTARGRYIFFSEPMRYGLYSPREGFIQLPRKVRWIEPVEGGIFVGQSDGVIFLAGNKPGELDLRRPSARPPIHRASATIQTAMLSLDQPPESRCAVWLSDYGFTLGLPTGTVMEPQAKRIRLSAARGEIVVHDQRLYAIVT